MAPIPLPSNNPEIGVRQDLASPPFVTPSITRVAASTTILVFGTPTTSQSPAATIYNSARPPSNNGGAILGGVLGGFFATILFIFLIWKCCWDPALAPQNHASEYSSDYDDDATNSSHTTYVRPRGGGGEEFRREHNRRARRVARPTRVHFRREKVRRRSSRSASSSVGRSGVFGWRFGGPTRPKLVATRETRRYSTSEKSRNGDLRFNVRDD